MGTAPGNSVAGRKNRTPRLFQLRRRERPREPPSRAPPPVIDAMTREPAREMVSTNDRRRPPDVDMPSPKDDSDAPEGDPGRDVGRTSNVRGSIETLSSSPSDESNGDVGTDVVEEDALEMMPRVVRMKGPRSRCHLPF